MSGRVGGYCADVLDLDFVRAQFPAFSRPETRDWVHAENAGGSYVPDQVIDLLTEFYVASKVQPYGPAGPAKVAGVAMDRGTELLPATLGCDADEFSLGPSTTQNTYVAAMGLAGLLEPGDRVVVTNQDHEANIGPWRRLVEQGIEFDEWQVDPATGLLDVADLDALLTERTKLVCVTHASNLAATVNPIAEIAEKAHAVGALLAVDGVSYAPHAPIDVRELDCDLYFYSTYKTYGPHLGAMYVRRSVLDSLTNQGHWFNASQPTKRLTPAGPNHAEVAAAAGIVDYYEAVHAHHGLAGDTLAERVRAVMALFGEHEATLLDPLMAHLRDADVRLVGAPSGDHTVRAPTVAFVPDGATPSAVVGHLANRGIGVNSGHFYAKRLADAMGIGDDGVVRISLVHYNTTDDVDRILTALDEVL